jgi:hypothetical protein
MEAVIWPRRTVRFPPQVEHLQFNKHRNSVKIVLMEWLLAKLSSLKDQVTILLSSLALMVSFATFYINVLRRPRLRILLGNNFGMVYERAKESADQSHNSKLPVALYLYVVIFNDGARHGALL